MSAAVLEPINPQSTSPLFNRIPAEIRNCIFKLALTAYDDHTKPYKNGEYYYRPGHRYAHKVDTNLLLTCRRVLAETKDIPASTNENTCWFARAPPWASTNGLTRLAIEDAVGVLVRHSALKYVHLFTQQTWLEGGFTHFTDLWKSTTPTHLTITLRHSDWWWWEREAPLALEPKYPGIPRPNVISQPSDPFDKRSWGGAFQKISGLETFVLELETVEKKKGELDAIVSRAPGWRFALHDGQVLVLDESRTTETGWLGRRLGMINVSHNLSSNILTSCIASHPRNSDRTPFAAKERLIKEGVKFENDFLEPGLAEDQYLAYYVVKLTWFARPAPQNLPYE